MKGNWNYPTSVRFGAGRIAELPTACAELGMAKPLIVTDPGIAGLPMLGEISALLGDHGVFTGVKGNPTGENVLDGVQVFRDGGHDGVIALGGGSPLDVGKAVALMAGQTGSLWDYEDVGDNWTRVNADAMAPVVAVPTTSGTGSEVGRASVIVDTADHTKKILFHPGMLPARVICDPGLTLGLPRGLTAATGMDALSHCLEAYCATGFHPMADGIAMEGIRLVQAYLPRAVADGSDLEARSALMAASSMGATAFQKGLGAMHAMAHPLGAVLDAHHGLLNAIVMPYVLAFNRPAIEDRIERLAALMGLSGFPGFLGWVLALRDELGIPQTLQSVGMEFRHCAELAPAAAKDAAGSTNPVPLDAENLETLLAACMEGRLP